MIPARMFGLVAISWILFSSGADAAEFMRGVLKDVQGSVEIQKCGKQEWLTAENGMSIDPGDRISAGMQGRAILEFPNSVTEISPMTQFVVGRTMEGANTFYTELFLQVGKVVSDVNAVRGKQNRFVVTTPSGVCGIRGSRQEVGHFPQTGTEMKMVEGHGYMGAVKPDQLPASVQAILGISPPAGATADPVDPVTAAQQLIQSAEPAVLENATADQAGLFGENALDYVYRAGEGQSIEAKDMGDPSGVVDVSLSLARDAVPDVTSSAISEKERIATQVTAEPADQPVTVLLRTDQAATADQQRTEIVTGSTTTTIRFPDRPGQ